MQLTAVADRWNGTAQTKFPASKCPSKADGNMQIDLVHATETSTKNKILLVSEDRFAPRAVRFETFSIDLRFLS
jgi:hypothetical protein